MNEALRWAAWIIPALLLIGLVISRLIPRRTTQPEPRERAPTSPGWYDRHKERINSTGLIVFFLIVINILCYQFGFDWWRTLSYRTSMLVVVNVALGLVLYTMKRATAVKTLSVIAVITVLVGAILVSRSNTIKIEGNEWRTFVIPEGKKMRFRGPEGVSFDYKLNDDEQIYNSNGGFVKSEVPVKKVSIRPKEDMLIEIKFIDI